MHKVNSMFAQRTNRLNKQTKKYHETAEKYIDDFHCDSVVKAYYALYRNGVTFFNKYTNTPLPLFFDRHPHTELKHQRCVYIEIIRQTHQAKASDNLREKNSRAPNGDSA